MKLVYLALIHLCISVQVSGQGELIQKGESASALYLAQVSNSN